MPALVTSDAFHLAAHNDLDVRFKMYPLSDDAGKVMRKCWASFESTYLKQGGTILYKPSCQLREAVVAGRQDPAFVV